MRKLLLSMILLVLLLSHCSKDEGTPARTEVSLGTQWTYRYKKFDAVGVINKTFTVKYKVSSEQMIGSDKWFVITDSTQAALFVLIKKADGLYHFTSNSPHLLCKFPATVNDTYTSYNNGEDELITVKEVGSTVTVPKGDIVVNRYEGEQGAIIKDIIWYNPDFWFVKKEVFTTNVLLGLDHIDTRIELVDVQY
jgi:hypothetical protein